MGCKQLFDSSFIQWYTRFFLKYILQYILFLQGPLM